MKVLVTGAGGWLGSELTKQLLEKGYEVRGLERKNTKILDDLKLKFNEKLEVVLGDICDFNFVNHSLKNIDVVYHLAAKVHSIPKTEEEKNMFFKVNTEGSKNLFHCAIKNKLKRVIFYSSVSVYGNSDEMITVNNLKKPETVYAESKLMAEEFGMKLYREQGLPITIIEPVTVYGGDDVGNFEKLKNLMEKGFVPRFGDGNNKKTVIYFEDLIRATINIAEDKNTIGKIIIVGSESLTLNEILEYLNINNKAKIVKINNGISNFIIKVLSLVKLNKFSRQISVLKSNNYFDIKESKKYIRNKIIFKKYYNR